MITLPEALILIPLALACVFGPIRWAARIPG